MNTERELLDLLKEIGIDCKSLSFSSPELLREYLGVEPGCVTPFGLINDIKQKVIVLLDRDLLNEKEVCFHPLINSATITIKLLDLFKFIEYCGQKKTIIENVKN